MIRRRNALKEKGFTLIELALVMMLIGILVTLTVPNYNTFRKNQSAVAAANEFSNEMRKARRMSLSLEQRTQVDLNGLVGGNRDYYYNVDVGDDGTTDKRNNVYKRYQGTRIIPNGNWTVSFYFEPDGSVTPNGGGMNLTVVSGAFGYYSFVFTAGGNYAAYTVQLYQNGDTKIIRTQ